MRNRLPRLVWGGLAIALAVFVTWVNGQPSSAGLIPAPWDKLAHFLTFATLSFLLCLAMGRRQAWLAFVLAVAFGGFDEMRQLYLVGRHADWADFGVDVLASALAITIARNHA